MIVLLCVLYGAVGWSVGGTHGIRWWVGLLSLLAITFTENAYCRRRVRAARKEGVDALATEIRRRGLKLVRRAR